MKATFLIRSLPVWIIFLIFSCGKKTPHKQVINHAPEVKEEGKVITFYDSKSISFFKTEVSNRNGMTAEITIPAKVSATVIPSQEGASQNIVLFENPELAANYTSLIQHQISINQIKNINIKQKEIELYRIKDLQAHGAASGKDLLDAQTALAMENTNLANERAALIEHETKLKAAGFNPEALRTATSGTAYITCDLPENQLNKITEGGPCTIQFTSFPEDIFKGKIDDIADVVDNITRMVKLRVTLKNPGNKLKAGMFALLSFGVREKDVISVPRTALITVQGKNYVFVKQDSLTFKREEVDTGPQIGDRIIVHQGIKPGSAVVVQGSIQLKGLSFGY
jgi:cobalt-zinc-cadmium efflux system membrane fusion protein